MISCFEIKCCLNNKMIVSRVVPFACSLIVHVTLFGKYSNSVRLKTSLYEYRSLSPSALLLRCNSSKMMISSQKTSHHLTKLCNGKTDPHESAKGTSELDDPKSNSIRKLQTIIGHKASTSLVNHHDYSRAIQDLNLLQSNTQVLALAKYKTPETIIPLFKRQLGLAGLRVSDLNRLNIIHVSGTKGKGSTCAFTESILRHAGLRTGFYNSPHLVKVTERIKINGQPIKEDLFAKYFRQIFDRLVEGTRREEISMPSYFSFLTILAFHIFLEESVDCSLIEVGIGGEYDPTNVIQQPVACAITTLDLDHTNILGKTIESIAWTKAGIIKNRCPTFTIQHEQAGALEMILRRANDKGSKVHLCEPFVRLPQGDRLGIDSKAQYTNASLACHLAKYLLGRLHPEKLAIVQKGPIFRQVNKDNTISLDLTKEPRFFSEGLVNCHWPGRCQVLEYSRVVFFIDGAHTRKSMENCLEWFSAKSTGIDLNARKILMINVIGERDRSEVLKPLTRYQDFSSVIFSTNRVNTAGDTPKSETFVNMQGPNCEKSMDNIKLNASTWLKLLKKSGDINNDTNVLIKANIMDGLAELDEMVMQDKDTKCHVLATGSLHFVGAILETLQSVDKSKFSFV